jgi:CcmD family protein
MDGFYSFLEKNSYYVVLIITLIIWLGLFLYMLSVDKKLKKIEKHHEVD